MASFARGNDGGRFIKSKNGWFFFNIGGNLFAWSISFGRFTVSVEAK